MSNRDLFPPIEPFETGRLERDPPHRLYWEQSGRPDGQPVVFLHGGPGAGASPEHRRFFDPAHYRIVVFDQRGAGRSNPLGELSANTTPHLIADIEALRERLGVERWLVFGGSWGSTLAIAYAETHPERVTGLVLRGIFLCRKKEIDWFLYGMRWIFPEIWRRFAEGVPEAERGDDGLGGAPSVILQKDGAVGDLADAEAGRLVIVGRAARRPLAIGALARLSSALAEAREDQL